MNFRILSMLIFLFLLFSCTQSLKQESISLFHWDLEIDKESPIYLAIKNKIGVELETISAPWTDWPNKLNMILASGNLPDIFITYGPGDADVYEKLVNDNMLLPLSPYLDKYPNIKKRLAGLERQKINNDFYALPVQLTIDHSFFIRQDWLDECNLTLPETVDDLYQIAVAFREKYKIYPITSSPPHTSGFFWLNPIFFAFNGGWEVWIKEQDQYIPCWISAGNKQALQYINRLYKEKLIDPEFFSNSDNDKVEKFINSKAGIIMHSSYPQLSKALFDVNPKAKISIFNPVKGPAGKAGMWSLDGFFTAISINGKLTENKRKKVLSLIDYLYSEEGLSLLRYGIKGVHWETDQNKKVPLLPKENTKYKSLENIDKTAGLRVFIELGGVWYPEWEENFNILDQIKNTAIQYGITDKFTYDKTVSAKEYSKRLYDLTMQHYVKMIKSEKPDQDWETYVNEFLASGGMQMIAERNP